MSEAKFTGHNWRIVEKLSGSENHKGFEIYSGQSWICDVSPMNLNDGNPSKQGRANAALIAAAPEMYEALQQAAQAIPTTHAAFETVRGALAKAA